MAFKNNDVTGNYEYNEIMKIVGKYGQIKTSQVCELLDLSIDEARLLLRRGMKKAVITEVTKHRFVAKPINPPVYSMEMEYALNLAILMAKGNEALEFNSFLKDKEEPFYIWMPIGVEEYDIAYLPINEEIALCNRIKRLNYESNYLLIIEHIGQLDNINLDKIAAVYLAKENGELEYVR